MADPSMVIDVAADAWRFGMGDSNRLPKGVRLNHESGAIHYDKGRLGELIKNAAMQFQQGISKAEEVRRGTGPITSNEFAALTRGVWASLFNDPRAHDIYTECGYPEFITPLMYRAMYDREGLATLVVNKFPEECWAQRPQVYVNEDETENEPFEERFEEFEKEVNLFHYCERIDKLRGIGSYGLFLIGIDDGKPLYMPAAGLDPFTGEEIPREPDEPEVKVNFIRCFDETECHIAKWNNDKTSPRYGHPELYLIRFNDASTIPVGQFTNDITTHMVHWTRVVHLPSDERKSNEWFGMPRMQNVYNRLQDCRKILSGSGEMFWKGAFPGYAFETNPELMDPLLDKESIRKEFLEYSRGLQRYLAVSGVSVKTLGIQMGDPTAHYDTQVKSIAMSKSIPWRVFVGSEQSQLASEQDTAAWNKRVGRRCDLELTPMLIRPITARFVALRCLPKPSKIISVRWPDIDSATDSQKADNFLKVVQGLATYVGGDVERVMDPLSLLTQIMKWPRKLAEAVIKATKEHVKSETQITPPDPILKQPGGNPNGPTPPTKPNNGGFRS